MPALLPPKMKPDTDAAVSVDAPARLHLGFLDPSGTLGRRFGITDAELTALPAADDQSHKRQLGAVPSKPHAHLAVFDQHAGADDAAAFGPVEIVAAEDGQRVLPPAADAVV